MKKLFSILSFENLKKNLQVSSSRFSITMILIILLSISFFAIINWDFSSVTEDRIIKTIFSLIITIFLSISVYLSAENSKLSKIKKNLLQIPVIIFWILFWFTFSSNINNFENLVFFILTLFWIISYLFFAPYLINIFKNNVEKNVYYSYFYKISWLFLVAFILWAILAILWNVAIMATFELFDIEYFDNFKVIANWVTLSFSFIAPIYALSQMPEKKEYNQSEFNENIFFSFLIKYTAIPFIYIYFFILYAYSAKVLLNFWDWPKWEISWLVIGFSIFGYLTYIFSYIFEEKNKAIKIFRKYFPFAVIPQIFMLFYAIYLRIAQYDFTINRYFVVIFWIWLLIISIYFVLSKKKNLIFVTSILTILTIIISIWPWWVYEFPQNRQFDRLQNNLQKANILNNWEINPLDSQNQIDIELSKNIYSWINYLCGFNNCDRIKNLFPEQYNSLVEKNKEELEMRKNQRIEEINESDISEEQKNEKLKNIDEMYEYSEPSKWEIVDYITDQIKVVSHSNNIWAQNRTISFVNNSNIFPINIEWYSKIIEITSYKQEINSEKINWYVDIQNELLKIYNLNEEIIEIDISEILEQVKQNNSKNENWNYNEMNLNFEIQDYKIIFRRLEIKNPKYKGSEDENTLKNYYYSDWYILIK